MRCGFAYLLAAVVLTAGVLVAATHLRPKLRDAAANLQIINADTGEATASAIYQRFARRRRAAESMQRTLRNVALAESLFVADSGYATIGPLLGRYAYAHESTFRLQVLVQADRWVALADDYRSSISCSLTAVLDTSGGTWRYHPREPVCIDWTAEARRTAQRTLK